ncbi:sarcalumenin-like [Oppia nitens]|uniref:sarcalumenin-like n=1 Tax=Oppia nitens TaxID=1686743 RepID=UPI0023DA4B0D|nr:sarcalumenin-like [Oppia nitens]
MHNFISVTILLIYLSTIHFDYYYKPVYGLTRVKQNDETKVKCKEVVDEALRQYWDHSNEIGHSRDGKNHDTDDDDDDNENNLVDNNSDEEETNCDNSEDNSDDNDDNDDDDDNPNPKSNENIDQKTNEEEEEESQEPDEEEEEEEEEHVDTNVGNNNNNQLKPDDDNDNNKHNVKREAVVAVAAEAKTTTTTNKEVPPTATTAAAAVKSGSDEENNSDNEKTDKTNDKEEDEEEEDGGEEGEAEEEKEKIELRSRAHIDDILRVYEIGSQEDTSEQNLILSIFRELKRLYESSVKPLEMIYKYRYITTRLITDAELFAKPKVLLLGGKSSGKTSLVNYLLGIDSSPMQLNTGLQTSYPHFSVLSYGDNYTRLSPTELSADHMFSSLQQFGQQFLDHYIEAHQMPIKLLQKMTIIDSPGLVDQISKTGTLSQPGIDNDVYQWFIDRSDVIYIVIDVTQLQLSHQLKSLIEQLRGRDVRFILSKSDQLSHSQMVTMIGQLLWILSPIMPSERAPQVYALTTVPQQVYDPFIDDQEVSWLKDLSNQISGISRVESRVAAIRRHAVRVRNHAKLIDCYLSTYYKNKGFFTFGASSRQLAIDITENPLKYRVYSGAALGQSQNISKYDLPDPGVYREFFRSNPLIDFKPLTSTCSYFKGCPIDKLDITIAYQLPELVGKYKKLTRIEPYL